MRDAGPGEARNELLNLEGECRRALEMIGQPQPESERSPAAPCCLLHDVLRQLTGRLRLDLSKASAPQPEYHVFNLHCLGRVAELVQSVTPTRYLPHL